MNIETTAGTGWWLVPSGWLVTVLPAVALALLCLLLGDTRMALVSLTFGSVAMLLARGAIVVVKRMITRFSSNPPPARRS